MSEVEENSSANKVRINFDLFRCLHTRFFKFRCLNIRFLKFMCLHTRFFKFRCLHTRFFKFMCLHIRIFKFRCLHTRFFKFRCIYTRLLIFRCIPIRCSCSGAFTIEYQFLSTNFTLVTQSFPTILHNKSSKINTFSNFTLKFANFRFPFSESFV